MSGRRGRAANIVYALHVFREAPRTIRTTYVVYSHACLCFSTVVMAMVVHKLDSKIRHFQSKVSFI